MTDPVPFHHCTRCGVRVGVYEPARIELADGTILSGSVLSVHGPRGAPIARVWHHACAEGDVAAPAA